MPIDPETANCGRLTRHKGEDGAGCWMLDAAGYDAMFQHAGPRLAAQTTKRSRRRAGNLGSISALSRDSLSILRWCQLDYCQFDVKRAFVLSHCSLRSVLVLAAHLEHGRTPLSSTVWPGGSVTRTYTVPEAPNQLRHVPTMGLEISQQWEA